MIEDIAKNVDRLVTVGARWGGRPDKWLIVPLYEYACKKLGIVSPSLAAAQKMVEKVKAGDRVFIVTGFGSYPRQPLGETDGPLGAASLARSIRLGLGALPVVISGHRDMEGVRQTLRAAGVNPMEYNMAKGTSTAVAAVVTFPCVDKEESRKFAANLLDEYKPKTIISVETPGPNIKGIKHSAAGYDDEAVDKIPGMEFFFYEGSSRGIFTVGCIDQGNELGSGTIEEEVKRITPNANACNCPCKSGIACVVKTDIVFPASISNWGAYAISAMLALLLKKPEILQDALTERRMLEACVMAGGCDGPTGQPTLLVDGVPYYGNEGMVSFLNCIVQNGLMGESIEDFSR